MNSGMYISFQSSVFGFFRCTHRIEIAKSHSSVIFSFLRKLQTVFHSGSTKLHSYQQWTSIPISPHPHQHVICILFDNSHSILKGVRWYLLWFWFACPWWLTTLSNFSRACWPYTFPFCKMFLCPFINWIVYIFDIELYEILIYMYGY